MKRGPKPAIQIHTEELCSYGCGATARYQNQSGRKMCNSSSAKCPENRKKNGVGGKVSYANGSRLSAKERYEILPQDTKNRMTWNKGNRTADFSYDGKGAHKIILISERGHTCEVCENTHWLDKPITLELEHKDGNNRNNIKENLQLLCPNCHSMTETWKGKNSKKKKDRVYVTDEDFKAALNSEKNVRQALIKLELTPKAANYERAYRLMHS